MQKAVSDVIRETINNQSENITDEAKSENNTNNFITDFETETDNVLSDDDETARQKAENRIAIRILKNTPDVILYNVKDSKDLPIIINYTKLYLAARENGVIKGN